MSKFTTEYALATVKSDANDAAWRVGVEKAISLAHTKLFEELKNNMSAKKANEIASFLSTKMGKHFLAFGVGVALDLSPQAKDPRILRLSKELRVYGLQFVFGFTFDKVNQLINEMLSQLPNVGNDE